MFCKLNSVGLLICTQKFWSDGTEVKKLQPTAIKKKYTKGPDTDSYLTCMAVTKQYLQT